MKPLNASMPRGRCSLKTAIERAARRETEQESLTAFASVDLSDVMHGALPPQDYVIAPYYPCGFVTGCGGHGGAGKSLLLLTQAAHAAVGRKWEGRETLFGRVVFVALEDDGAMIKRRLRRIVNKFGLDAELLAANLLVLDGTASNSALARDVHGNGDAKTTRAFEELRKVCDGALMIVVDGASDGFDANENDRRAVRAFVRMLAALARENNAAVVLLMHVDKNAVRNGSKGNSYSGSTAWHNSVRSRIALEPDEDGGVWLLHQKHNLGRCAKPLSLAWDENGLLVLATAAAAPAQIDQARLDAAAVLAALRAANAAGVNVPASRVGSFTGRHALATCGLPIALSEKAGLRRFWSAIDFLIAEGCAERQKFVTEQRKKSERIMLRESAPNECAPSPPITPCAIGALGSAACAESAPNPIGAHSAQLGAEDCRRASGGE